MNVALLQKLFPDGQWNGPCTIVLEASASIQALGQDMVQGGQKVFSPRAISGRLPADAACLTSDGLAVLVVSQQKVRMATGGDVYKQALTVVDAEKVVAIELTDASLLATFGVMPPVIKTSGSSSGSETLTQTKPK